MIDLVNIALQFDGNYIFTDISYKISPGDSVSLVGANGTGKSSLLKMIKGELLPEKGSIHRQRNLSTGYLPQERITHSGNTLMHEAVSALTGLQELRKKEAGIAEQLTNETITGEERDELVMRLGEVHHRLEELDSYSAESGVEKILEGLGFRTRDLQRPCDEFSGGWQMRIALAKLLISDHDLLLLDEPTNHLDIDSLRWLIGFLKSFRGAMIIVSHDRYFINAVTNRTLEIFNGKGYAFNGNFDAWLHYKEERDRQLEHQHVLQQKKIKETKRFIERFRYKNTKAKQVQSRIKQLEKMEIVELPENQDDISFTFPKAPPSGRIMMTLEGIDKAYGDNVVFKDLDLIVERGEKIALVGPNGAGKTTLAKIIADQTEITGGSRTPGHKVEIAYFAQDVTDTLDLNKDIIDSVDEIAGNEYNVGQLRSFLGSFLFTGDDVFKSISVLSGGEKSRVALARILLLKANLLILDEPTNHLDYASKRVLQKALNDFEGTVILVSHDIDFLKPLVTKVIEIQPGSFKTYIGGIEYYLYQKAEEEKKISEGASGAIAEQSAKPDRKERKRAEAEKRNRRYELTKDILKSIEDVESSIESLEKKEKQLEAELADEKVYSNPAISKEKNSEYAEVKEALSGAMEQWEELQLTLAEIEEQFE